MSAGSTAANAETQPRNEASAAPVAAVTPERSNRLWMWATAAVVVIAIAAYHFH